VEPEKKGKIMTVNNIGVGNTQTPTDNRSNGTTSASATSVNSAPSQQTSGGGSDTVQISSQAVDLQALESHINQLPDVDATRVTEIRTLLANDQFEINSAQLAEKILGFEAKLADQ